MNYKQFIKLNTCVPFFFAVVSFLYCIKLNKGKRQTKLSVMKSEDVEIENFLNNAKEITE